MEKPEEAQHPAQQPQDFAALMKSVADIVDAVLAQQPMPLPQQRQSRWKRTRQLQGGGFPLAGAAGWDKA